MPQWREAEDLPIQHNGVKLVESKVRERAKSASNILNGNPLNEIVTNKAGVVLSVTPEFCDFTGYSEEEMIGRKCNFLQGEGTSKDDVMELRRAMRAKQPTSVVILNYCKDGAPFWNILTILPKLNVQQELEKFTGEVISLRIPPRMRDRPRLCVDDALALIAVYASVPRAINLAYNTEHGIVLNKDLLTNGDGATTEDDEDESMSGTHSAWSEDSTVLDSSGASVDTAYHNNTYKHQNYGERFAGKDFNREPKYRFVAETALPTHQGRFRVRAYRDNATGAEPLAMIVGNVEGRSEVVVRVHDQCLTSEVFGSLKCDCKEQLDYAQNYIQEHEGIVLYLPQEGRGIGLANKVAAYAAQESGLDTVDANRHLGLPDDAREYNSVRDILEDMNIKSIKLLSNNPRKFSCLKELGVQVVDRIPCVIVPNSEYSMKYVHSKAERMGHMINMKTLSTSFANILRPTTPPARKPPAI